MPGLELDGQHDAARGMLQNFGFELDRYGRIPNGSRSYYLSRSQPPFFSLMVDLIAARDGDATYRQYLPELKGGALPPARGGSRRRADAKNRFQHRQHRSAVAIGCLVVQS